MPVFCCLGSFQMSLEYFCLLTGVSPLDKSHFITVFCYQIRYVGLGKQKLSKSLNALKPKLERYTMLTRQMKSKLKKRKALLAEKKDTPFYLLAAHNNLAKQITELTEDLEELKSERVSILSKLRCSGDAEVGNVRKRVANLEKSLERLAQQEGKYSNELNVALKQYAELQEQAKKENAEELANQRAALRPEKDQSATAKIQEAYGDKYDPGILLDSKRDVAKLLGEETESRSIMERLQMQQENKVGDSRSIGKQEQER